ncbi:MAG: biotin--[acetyl-CoA-carboxylase] ligase [Microthrixaceae bacterium]|nr:biotin--[acetyl-CoA-carboxylase] ligase [Microthrixaceae bacterium]
MDPVSRTWRWLAETDSTNTDARRILLSAAGVPPGPSRDVVVVADHQRAGRGRLGRVWEAPTAASLLMSVGTVADVRDEDRGLLLTAMSLAALDAIEAQLGLRLMIKWPNDLVAVTGSAPAALKVAGVLAEAVTLSDGRTGYVVGIGINCNWVRITGPLADTAASLDILVGSSVDREALAVGVIKGFEERLGALEAPGGEGSRSLLGDARARSATLGGDVEVQTPEGLLRGRAVDLDDDGALLVDTGNAAPRRIVVGDVVSLRPS